MTTIEQVAQFHKTFVEDVGLPMEKIKSVRLKLFKEELQELEDAIAANDQVEILDALSDIQYILDGTYIAFGLAHVKDCAFAEVHRSNMTRVGVDGKPLIRPDGKILKGPNYQPPQLAQFIKT